MLKRNMSINARKKKLLDESKLAQVKQKYISSIKQEIRGHTNSQKLAPVNPQLASDLMLSYRTKQQRINVLKKLQEL